MQQMQHRVSYDAHSYLWLDPSSLVARRLTTLTPTPLWPILRPLPLALRLALALPLTLSLHVVPGSCRRRGIGRTRVFLSFRLPLTLYKCLVGYGSVEWIDRCGRGSLTLPGEVVSEVG